MGMYLLKNIVILKQSDAGVIDFTKPITGLLDGHSYCMIGYFEDEDIKLINLRNPWENLGSFII